jgi:hypothetical protein
MRDRSSNARRSTLMVRSIAGLMVRVTIKSLFYVCAGPILRESCQNKS